MFLYSSSPTCKRAYVMSVVRFQVVVSEIPRTSEGISGKKLVRYPLKIDEVTDNCSPYFLSDIFFVLHWAPGDWICFCNRASQR